MNGESPEKYLRRLREELHQGMSLATLLSRAMVSRAGQKVAPFALTVLPRAIDWIARSTRIPERALPEPTST
jgi:hypothetical protein